MSEITRRRQEYIRTHVYNEAFRTEPKELHRVVLDDIGECGSLIDIGGAGGELAHFALQRWPDCNVTVVDADPCLVEIGARRVPAQFVSGSAERLRFPDDEFEVATMIGVLSIFDTPAGVLSEALRVASRAVYVVGIANPFPVDVWVRWRYSDDQRGDKNLGYNCHSQATIDGILGRLGAKSWEWMPFTMPFDLEKHDDPIRSWTEMHNGRRELRNAVGSLPFSVLRVEV